MVGIPRPDLDTRHVAAIALAAALAVMTVPGVAADHGDGAISHCENPSETVELVDSFQPFDPAFLVIEAGTCVEFVNVDTGVPHTVRVLADTNANVDEDVDPILEPGESTNASFDEPGTYEGNCEFHPALMHGVIEVV